MTIIDIIGLFFDLSSFNVYITETGDTFNFDESSLPLELEYIPIESIDDPLSYEDPTPFTINVSKESFDNYESFKEEFTDNMK